MLFAELHNKFDLEPLLKFERLLDHIDGDLKVVSECRSKNDRQGVGRTQDRGEEQAVCLLDHRGADQASAVRACRPAVGPAGCAATQGPMDTEGLVGPRP